MSDIEDVSTLLPVPAQEAAQPIVPVHTGEWDLSSAASVDYTTSLDRNKGDQVSLMMKARLQKGIQLGDHIGKSLSLVHWLAHHANWVDGEGEVTPGVRIVLIDEQGVCYSCGSVGVRSALKLLIQVLGPGPYHPPVPATVVQQRTRNGFQMLSLDFDLSKHILPATVGIGGRDQSRSHKKGGK